MLAKPFYRGSNKTRLQANQHQISTAERSFSKKLDMINTTRIAKKTAFFSTLKAIPDTRTGTPVLSPSKDLLWSAGTSRSFSANDETTRSSSAMRRCRPYSQRGSSVDMMNYAAMLVDIVGIRSRMKLNWWNLSATWSGLLEILCETLRNYPSDGYRAG
jgi:hypothetical protein